MYEIKSQAQHKLEAVVGLVVLILMLVGLHHGLAYFSGQTVAVAWDILLGLVMVYGFGCDLKRKLDERKLYDNH